MYGYFGPGTTQGPTPRGGGGDTLIHKLYGDVPPFRVWFFDRPLINRISNSKIFEDFLETGSKNRAF